MSLLGTLAKVAIGIAVAKGVGALVNKGKTSAPRGTRDDDGRYGGPHSPGREAGGRAAPGDLGGVMDDILGGASAQTGGAGAGSSGAGSSGAGGTQREQGAPWPQTRGSERSSSRGPWSGTQSGNAGDLGDVLGGMLGGAGSGGLGGLLEQLNRAARGAQGSLQGDAASPTPDAAPPPSPQQGTFGDLLNQAIASGSEPAAEPTPDQEAMAEVMLSAMIQAAKSDGRIDPSEQGRLTQHLGDATQAEMDFVRGELARPVDIGALCARVPKGMEDQVYAVSLVAIDLDSQIEARYLAELAAGLGLDGARVNAIHRQVGAPPLQS